MGHVGKFVTRAKEETSEIYELIIQMLRNLSDDFLAEDGVLMYIL